MKTLLDYLTTPGWETEGFPAEACTIPNKREPEVLDSDRSYLCILADHRFGQWGSFNILSPYTAPNLSDLIEEGEPAILYGWTDDFNVFGHYTQSCHEDDAVVVAWREIPAGSDLRLLAGLPMTSSV